VQQELRMSVDASHWKDVVDMYCPDMSLEDATVGERERGAADVGILAEEWGEAFRGMQHM
jgi:hypothetical protein